MLPLTKLYKVSLLFSSHKLFLRNLIVNTDALRASHLDILAFSHTMLRQDITVNPIGLLHLPVEGTGSREQGLNGLK